MRREPQQSESRVRPLLGRSLNPRHSASPQRVFYRSIFAGALSHHRPAAGRREPPRPGAAPETARNGGVTCFPAACTGFIAFRASVAGEIGSGRNGGVRESLRGGRRMREAHCGGGSRGARAPTRRAPHVRARLENKLQDRYSTAATAAKLCKTSYALHGTGFED